MWSIFFCAKVRKPCFIKNHICHTVHVIKFIVYLKGEMKMKMERMRNEMELFNKVNGKMYKVTSFDGTTAVAAEMLPDDTLGEKIDIIAANALAFRIESDPAPYPVPTGYTVFNGILMKDGEPVCEQGQIYINDILAAQPNTLILSVRTREKVEGKVDLFSYEVNRDRFIRQATTLPEDLIKIPYENADGLVIIGYCNTSTDKIKDEDGKEKEVPIFLNAEIMVLSKGKIIESLRMNEPVTIGETIVKLNPLRKELNFFVPSDEEVDDDCIIKERKERCWIQANDDGEFMITIGDDAIEVNWSPVYKHFVVMGENTVYLCRYITSPKIKELAGYGILIDKTDDGPYTTRYTFCNEAYEMKTLVYQTTKDRGAIITVE